jgi:hypothetical protein
MPGVYGNELPLFWLSRAKLRIFNRGKAAFGPGRSAIAAGIDDFLPPCA